MALRDFAAAEAPGREHVGTTLHDVPDARLVDRLTLTASSPEGVMRGSPDSVQSGEHTHCAPSSKGKTVERR